MGRCGAAHGMRVRLAWALLSLAMISCSRHGGTVADGVSLLDQDIALVRGERRDTATREFRVDDAATFVAFVYEEDCDVSLGLEARGASPSFRQVNNTMYGESLEVVLLDVPAKSRLLVALDSAQDFDVPCHSRVRVQRYDATATRDARVAARLDALRSWSEVMRTDRATETFHRQGLQELDRVAEQLEWESGDRWLAAWARLVRADLNYVHGFDYSQAADDARAAWATFEELGDAHNASRGRYVYATVMAEIATDRNALNPTAEEAERQAHDMLVALASDPALSAVQRARALNFQGVRALDGNQWLVAGQRYREALAAFQKLGDRQGQRMALNNLGVLAAEVGDFQAATQYFDKLVPTLDQVGKLSNRVVWMIGAARADTDAGYVDRAISRLLQAQEWNRELQDPTCEARILHALGRAYWARGDLAQASAFIAEGLRVRRSIKDPIGVMASLRYAGIMAREAGKLSEAIDLHREAVELAASPDLKLRGLLDLAQDYAAMPDWRRAIATCREALAQPSVSAEFYKRLQAQLALGDFLLSQPSPGIAAIAEAESLAVVPLRVATRRSDITLELAARHLQARVRVARRQWVEARAEYERAIDLIFRYRSTSTNPELQASAMAREDATFRGYLDLLMRGAVARGAGGLRPASADEMDALRMLEWARATSFTHAGALASDGKTGARIDALLAQMAGKRVRIATLMERSVEPTREVEALQLDIAQMRAEIDRLRAGTDSTPATTAASIGAPDLPQLTAHVAQWSYALGAEHVYLWVRDLEGTRSAVLPLSGAELQRRLAALATSARRSSATAWETSVQQLGMLLVPRDSLRKETARLEVVTDGTLAGAPFAALLPAEVTMVGSMYHAGARAGTGARARRFVGVAGNAPGGGFPALAATTGEARSIAAMFDARRASQVKLLLGDDATMEALGTAWREGTDVLHMATHGLADLRQPMTSLLMLPAKDAQGAATYLTAGQVQSWVGDVGLVYLSACETAIGPARFADGMPGLQRAFLRAGAQGVIATLWPIEDVYASQFATDFYRRYTAGTAAPGALAETQRAWMRPAAELRADELAHRRMTAWAHAYYTP